MLNTSQMSRAQMPEVTMLPKTSAGRKAKATHGSLSRQRSAIRRGKSSARKR